MIKRIAFRNFRSLQDVELDLGPLTVLIGPNGAGKSNVIDALRFIDSFAWKGRRLGDEVDGRGGWEELVWGGRSDSGMEVAADCEQESNRSLEYSATIHRSTHGEAVADSESLVVNGGSLVERRGHLIQVMYSEGFRPLHPDLSVVRFAAPGGIAPELANTDLLHEIPRMPLPDWSFYDLVPGETRGPKPIKREYRLDVAGSNLATVVHTLFSDADPALDDALDFLKGCVPTVERLVSPIFGAGETYVALAERNVPRPVGSWGLSDGTLLAFAIAVALVTPKPPDLVCLESPEVGIHPRMLEAVADLLKAASADTQVIVTTHSPYLLRWLPYEHFVVVDKVDGATKLRPLHGKADLHDLVRELGAGEAWYAGYLGGVP